MRKNKWTDEEIVKLLIKHQTKNPELTLTQLCVKCGFTRTTLFRRQKKSEAIRNAIKKAHGVREDYWTRLGFENLHNTSSFNTTLYIWMTRNIIGWRNEPEPETNDDDESYPEP